jgi:hypothetical protein
MQYNKAEIVGSTAFALPVNKETNDETAVT